MNIKTLSAVVGGILALGAMTASAAPILVAEWLGNSGSANELADVQAKILAYNVANAPDLPAFSGTTSVTLQSTAVATYAPNNEKIVEWTAPATYDFYYVMTKFGKGQANFDHALHYLLAGETLSYNPGGTSAPNGLSHVSIWAGDLPNTNTHLPDNGWSVALLGLGAFGIARLRR
jgi:hypothetical protein